MSELKRLCVPGAYPRPISEYPKKKNAGRTVMKNVWVPKEDV